MKDFIIDFETLGTKPDAIVVDMSVVVFDSDPNKLETFKELIESGRRFKFNINSQKGIRTINQSTLDFWKTASLEAKENLKASSLDLEPGDAIELLLDYLKSSGINQWKSQGWCRGMSFDFPLLVDLIRERYKTLETDQYEPIKFWNQRDIRTAIECYSMVRGMSLTPLKIGVLDGFVHHDSVHDCAKDVLMLKMAQRYALGLDEIPSEDLIDPKTVKK